VALSPGGALLATGADDNTVRLWNVHTGAFLQRHSKHTDRVFAVAFWPDGRTQARGSRDKSLVVCRCASL
jgi:WD40 repeat protein